MNSANQICHLGDSHRADQSADDCDCGGWLEEYVRDDDDRFSWNYKPPAQRLEPVTLAPPLWTLTKGSHSATAQVKSIDGVGPGSAVHDRRLALSLADLPRMVGACLTLRRNENRRHANRRRAARLRQGGQAVVAAKVKGGGSRKKGRARNNERRTPCDTARVAEKRQPAG